LSRNRSKGVLGKNAEIPDSQATQRERASKTKKNDEQRSQICQLTDLGGNRAGSRGRNQPDNRLTSAQLQPNRHKFTTNSLVSELNTPILVERMPLSDELMVLQKRKSVIRKNKIPTVANVTQSNDTVIVTNNGGWTVILDSEAVARIRIVRATCFETKIYSI
jgi:hypothetical protein